MDSTNLTLTSINAATATALRVGQRQVRTGHFKVPLAGPVNIGEPGVPGDFIGNHKHHGGPDQAVYLFSLDDMDWWANMLRRDVAPGLFGENLTISHWWTNPRVGDRLRCGSLLLELTGPRTPCATLEASLGVRGLSQAFVKAERCGAYARILSPGTLRPGDTLVLERADMAFRTIAQVFRYWHGRGDDRVFLSAALAAPLAHRIAGKFRERLARLDQSEQR
jgi:MOSC domain-containing protein YiiM